MAKKSDGMMDGMMDMGKPYPETKPADPKQEKKVSYPSVYVSGMKGHPPGTGKVKFSGHGHIASVTKRKKDDGSEEHSYEMEVHGLKFHNGDVENPKEDAAEGGLEEALDTIQKKKAKK